MEERFILRFTLFLLFLQGTSCSEGEAPWFLGCYNESEETEKSSFEPVHQEKQLTPFFCVQLCLDEKYAAVRNGSICFCKASLDHGRNTSLKLCNVSCHGNTNFFCGGTNVSSVYSTAVPVIVSITLNLPNQVRLNASVNATSELSIMRPRGEVGSLDGIREGNTTAKNISLRWYHDSNFLNAMSYTLQENATRLSFLHVFTSPGEHIICANAANLFSSVRRCVDVDVLLPVSGLQVVALYHGSTLLNLSLPLLVTTREAVYMKFLISSGSQPVFTFNFGDGSFPLTVVDTSAALHMHSSSYTCVTASHVFLRCGNFSLNVTVSNAVSQESVTLPEKIQVQMVIKFVDAERWGRKCIDAELGSEASLTAKVCQDDGCTVFFEWNFGDSSPNTTTTVPSVSHQFQGVQSKYKVKVVAFNAVSRKQATIDVCMQERLKGVVVEPGGPLAVKTDQVIDFNIKMAANSTVVGFGAVRYNFNKGDGSDEIPVGTIQKSVPISYKKPGRYIAFGTATNKISTIRSNKVAVSVFDPVGQLSIKHNGTTLVGTPTHLVARLNLGTNVTFHWNFGDELENKTLTSRTVTYTFIRRGKYKVRLVAENDVSSEVSSMTLYVTNISSCYPPEVKILGVFSGWVMRSKEIRLEADVAVDCSASVEFVYLWKVIHLSGPKTSKHAVLDGVSVTEQVLIIPSLLLDYGFYSFQLEVVLKGTFLSRTLRKIIEIGRSDLIATIAGGTIRVVGVKNNVVTLNASGSHDPDYPDEKHNIRFSWSCHLLGKRSIPCFNMTKVNKTSSVLSFHIDWLSANAVFDGLELEVTVSKGFRNFSASQVLYLYRGESHVLSAECAQCDQGIISASEELVVSGFCQSCPVSDSSITYQWRLYRVGGKNPSGAYECPALDQSPLKKSERKSSAVNAQPTSATRPFPSPHRTYDKPPLIPIPTGNPAISQPTNPSFTSKSQGRISRGRICRDPEQLLAPTEYPSGGMPTRRPWPPGSGIGSGSGCASGVGVATGSGSGSGSGGFPRGSGSGSASGHAPSWPVIPPGTGTGPATGHDPENIYQGKVNNGTLTTNSPSTNFTTDHPVLSSKDPESVLDPRYVSPLAKKSGSIIGLRRHELKFPVHQTTTGRHRKNLVLKGKFLEGGNVYMLAISVFDRSTDLKGMASVVFKTNRNPHCETCTVTPSVGVTTKNAFQLSCFRGNVENRGPLTYQVSYNVVGDGVAEETLIYTGYRSEVSFVLPPGLMSFNHKVKVHVVVVDRLGSRKKIQPLSVRVVLPKLEEGVTMEEILLNETCGKRLSSLLKAGNQQGVRQFSTTLAYCLNSLGPERNVSSKLDLRVQTREELLRLIHKLTVDDKGSALQTCMALKALTDKPSELSAVGLKIASQILQNLGEMSRLQRSEDRNSLNQAFINSITKITSNLIDGTRKLVQSGRGASHLLHETKRNILVGAIEATEKVMKAKLSMQVLGEEGLQAAMPYVRVRAAVTPTVSRSLLFLDGVMFKTPEDLDDRLNGALVAGSASCFQTIMTVYKENPFPDEMDHTQVVSLSVSSCRGQEMSVRNLSRRFHISIPNSDHKIEERARTFSLKWEHVNIHTIQQVEKMVNQSLYIHLKPLSPLPPGFALRVTVSLADNASSSESRRIVHSSSTFGGVINLYLDKHKLRNASETLYARILLEDTAYYRIRQVKRGPSLTYMLGVRWMGCFYWHKGMEQWLTDGCQLMQDSTVELFHCSCNHLTVFSGAFVYPPNTFDSKSLADVERLRKSPITLVVVIVVTVLYAVLLYVCAQADKHDRKKLGAVYIYDYTSAVTSQKYKISVETGHWFGAGTSANVFMVLHGEDLVSDPLELKCEGKPLFGRSSSDVFIVSAPENFGPIWKVHIWHDNEGHHPNWFLERVIVKDVTSRVKWIFDCHRWLAVDRGNGKVECVLLASSDKSTSFKASCSRHLAKSLLDYHLWLSIIGRPSYSNFSRAQRLTCCFSLLLSFLCVNIAWYRPKTQVSTVLGAMDITIETIVVGLLCSLIALPPNLLWILLFRYSKPKLNHSVYPSSEPPTEFTELVTSGKEDTLSIWDHSLETLLYLKNLGQRRRWFQTTFHMSDVRSHGSFIQSDPFDSEEIAESSSEGPSQRYDDLNNSLPSDGSSLGYKSGQDAVNSEQPLSNLHPGSRDFVPDSPPALADVKKRNLSATSSGPGINRSSRLLLPSCFVYVAWLGCLLTASSAGALTVLYGISFGWDLSLRWLQSLCISLIESFLVSQPIMVVAFFLYVSVKSCSKMKDDDVDEGFEDASCATLHESHYTRTNQGFKQDSDEEDVDPALAARRRQRYLKFLKPLSKSKLIAAREKCIRSKDLVGYVTELVVFLLVFVVTGLLVASLQSPNPYRLHQALKTTFLRSQLNPSLFERESINDSWYQVSKALNENGVSSSHAPFTTLLRDTQSLLFGRIRITQYKAHARTVCEQVVGNSSHSINGTFRVKSKDTNETEAMKVCYSTCDAHHGSWISVKLNQSRSQLERQLKTLTDSEWIGGCTKEIAVEFAVYTPFLHAISAATLSVKASLIGRPTCDLDLHTFPAFFKVAGYGYFWSACKLLFVVLFLYLLQHEFFLFVKLSGRYLLNFWRLTQLLIVILASMCVVVYVRWSVSLYALMREVETEAQERVFDYAKLASWNQETLSFLYSFLLFVSILRLGHLLRPSSTMRRLGRALATAIRPLMGIAAVFVAFVMAFAHPGYLMFGGLHSAFSSFGATFLLVCSFFRLEGASRSQGAAFQECPLLSSFYVGVFSVGWWVVMKGLSATVLVRAFLHSRKRRFDHLADVIRDFIRRKIQSLARTRKRTRQRRESDSDEDEDFEDDDEDFEECTKDAPFPLEYVFDELECQIEELSFRVNNLTGFDLLNDRCLSDLSCADSEGDVEYLYPAEQPYLSEASGYESDRSNTSGALRWHLSSSSSRDNCGRAAAERHHDGPLDDAMRNELLVSDCKHHDQRLFFSEEPGAGEERSNNSCSGCCEISGNNTLRAEADRRKCPDEEGVGSPVPSFQRAFTHDAIGILRSNRTQFQELSSSSSHSLSRHTRPDREPMKPKTLYGLSPVYARQRQGTFSNDALSRADREAGELGATEAATNSSSDREAVKKTKTFSCRRARGLFRSAAVYPSQEGLPSGPIIPCRPAHRKDSESSSSSDLGPRPAWDLAPSVSERRFGVVRQHVRKPLVDSGRPSEGLIGNIGVNRK